MSSSLKNQPPKIKISVWLTTFLKKVFWLLFIFFIGISTFLLISVGCLYLYFYQPSMKAFGLRTEAYNEKKAGHFAQAASLMRQALSLDQSKLGEKAKVVTEEDMPRLAAYLSAEGKFAEAESICTRCEQIIREHHDADYLKDMLSILCEEGYIFSDDRKFAQAEEKFQSRISLCESLENLDEAHLALYQSKYLANKREKKRFYEQPPRIIETLDRLAQFYENRNDYLHAEQILFKLIAMKEKVFGSLNSINAIEYYKDWNRLANSLDGQHKYKEAAAAQLTFIKGIEISEQDNGLKPYLNQEYQNYHRLLKLAE